MILSMTAAFAGGALATGLWQNRTRLPPELWAAVRPDSLDVPELPAPGAPPPLPPGWGPFGGARPEIRGWPEDSVLAVRGLQKQPPEVLRALLEVCEQLGVPVDTVATVVSHESGWNPAALYFKDKKDDGTPRKVPFVAAGICQLTVEAHLEGFGDWQRVREITSWPVERQLREVVLPLWSKYGDQVRGAHPGRGLMLNFLPDKAGGPEDKVLGEKSAAGFVGRVYAMNTGLDVNRDGKITIGDVYASAARVCRRAEGRRVRLDGSIWRPPPGSRVVVAPASPGVTTPRAPSTEEASAAMAATSTKKGDSPSAAASASAAVSALAASSSSSSKNDAPPGREAASSPSAASSSKNDASPGRAAASSSPAAASTEPPMDLGPLAELVLASKPPAEAASASAALASTAPRVELVTSPGGGHGEPVTSAAARSATGRPMRLGDVAGGLLVAAIREGREEPPIWTDVLWEGRGKTTGTNLVVRVSAHAVRAAVEIEGLGKRLLRLPISYQEQLEVCRLRRWFPLTQNISDAVWTAAHRINPPLLGKWTTQAQVADSSRRMRTLEWVVQFNEQLDRQIPVESWHRLWATEGKDWIVHPRIAERAGGKGAINYGLHKLDGIPWQSPGGKHDWTHFDQTQVLRAMEWEGTDPATGKKVPIIEVLRKAGMPAAVLAPFEGIT